MNDDIRRIVERFELIPHPEGGFYRETYRADMRIRHPGVGAGEDATRSAGTHIYYLFPADDFSAFHRVTRSDEIWHLYAGDDIEIHVIHEDGRYEKRVLSTDLAKGEPATLVPAGAWQAARCAPGGRYSFGGCTVAPGFEFADFEMPPGDDIVARHPQHEAIIRELTKR